MRKVMNERASLLNRLLQGDSSDRSCEIASDFAGADATASLRDEIRIDFGAGHCGKWLLPLSEGRG
jgi:hypothetical protein